MPNNPGTHNSNNNNDYMDGNDKTTTEMKEITYLVNEDYPMSLIYMKVNYCHY